MPNRKEDEGLSSFTKLLRLEEFNQVKSPTKSDPTRVIIEAAFALRPNAQTFRERS